MLPSPIWVDMLGAPRSAIRPCNSLPRCAEAEPLSMDGEEAYPEGPSRGYRLLSLPVRVAATCTEEFA